MRLDLAHNGRLLLTDLRGLGVEEVVADAAVELVHVHAVDAVLQTAVFALKLGDGLVVKLLLVGVAAAERPAHPVQCLLGERDPLEDRRELLLQHLLARVGLRALPLVARAVVVHVLALFDLAHHGAAAVAACNQPGEGEVLLDRVELPGATAIEDRLDLLP